MFRIKICGLTNIADALAAVDAGADAIGLNFFSKSPRYVTPEVAAEIVAAVSGRCETVGVFVNATLEEILNVGSVVPLTTFQLHGDEPTDLVRELLSLHSPDFISSHPMLGWLFQKMQRPGLFGQVIRAFRCREPNLTAVADYLRECQQLHSLPTAVLLDAYQPGTYGGTGHVVDWDVVRRERNQLHGLPLILAGGLTPTNVDAAIAATQADAVDTASGVESSPGKKDHGLIQAFIQAARSAFGESSS